MHVNWHVYVRCINCLNNFEADVKYNVVIKQHILQHATYPVQKEAQACVLIDLMSLSPAAEQCHSQLGQGDARGLCCRAQDTVCRGQLPHWQRAGLLWSS